MRLRRAAANVALAALAGLIVVTGLRAVPGAGAVGQRVRPAALALGVEQNWGVFAPVPRMYGLRLEAAVRWSDGHRDVWRVPEGDPVLAAYRDYRWRKWAERLSSLRSGRPLWRPAVLYIARNLPERPAATPVEVRLVRRIQRLPAPGSHERYGWRSREIYRATLGVRGDG